MVKTPIYLDYQATTPMDSLVLDSMLPFFKEKFGNPHSATHRFGWEASEAVEVARGQIASVISGASDNVYFTSGATEANNLALKGVMEAQNGARKHLIVAVSEHKCVLETANYLKSLGYELTILPVGQNGLINLAELEAAVSENTALVSVMAVNNEIGVIQPLKKIAEIAHAKGAYFHTDAAQAFGKIPLDVKDMGIDLLSISGHKIYGPKGIGALYVRGNTGERQGVRIATQMHGGGQEGFNVAIKGAGLRSGTLAPALCVGLGVAAKMALEGMAEERKRIAALAAVFRGRILLGCGDVRINGSLDSRYEGNLNISFGNIDGDKLITELRDLAVSSGAACASATTGPSYVLEALGLSDAEIKSSIRFGFGRFTTEDEVVFAADYIAKTVKKLIKG